MIKNIESDKNAFWRRIISFSETLYLVNTINYILEGETLTQLEPILSTNQLPPRHEF